MFVMSSQSTAPSATCPKCGDPLIPNKTFCANCGLALAPTNQIVAIEAYVAAKVEQQLRLSTNDSNAIVRDVAFKAENEAIARLKRYWWIAAGMLALGGVAFTVFGISTINDAKQKIVSEAAIRVEPIVKDVERRANDAQTNLEDVQNRLPSVVHSLNETAKQAEEQRRRMEGQSAEVAAKIKAFDKAAIQADQLAATFQLNADQAQRRLTDITRRYDSSLQQISHAATSTAISEAFPNLDTKQFIQIGNWRFDLNNKQTDEKWVNLDITGMAQRKHLITQKELESMVSELNAAGLNILPGVIAFGGPGGGLVERADKGDYTQSAVIYFRLKFKPVAEKLFAICSKYVKFPPNSVILNENDESNGLPGLMDFIRKDGKLDAEIFISAPM